VQCLCRCGVAVLPRHLVERAQLAQGRVLHPASRAMRKRKSYGTANKL
jgi:hypothetical protein